MLITYVSNNSGGSWWLKDEDWLALEKAGWRVAWVCEEKGDVLGGPDKDGRWLGALAKEASKEFPSPGAAMQEFEEITGEGVSDEGCNCCGPPHSFDWEDGYASGAGCGVHRPEALRRDRLVMVVGDMPVLGAADGGFGGAAGGGSGCCDF